MTLPKHAMCLDRL